MVSTPCQTELKEAFGTIRSAKNFFFSVLGLCLLIQLAGFLLVDRGGVVDQQVNPVAVVSTTQPATQPTTSPTTTPVEACNSANWYCVLFWAMPAAKFFAFVSAILLAVTLLAGAGASMCACSGGSGSLLSSFFWSLVLLAIVTPWQQILPGSFSSGAMFNLTELIEYGKKVKVRWNFVEKVAAVDVVLYYLRFLGSVIIALLVWLKVQSKFSAGLRKVSEAGAPPATPK
jgi:hypothetical protein